MRSVITELFLAFGVFTLAACQNLSPSCVQLQRCIATIEHGPQGTLSFLQLDHYPSQSEWDTLRYNICASKRQRIRCAVNHGCTDQGLISDARVAKERARKMCRPEGREFLRRVRAEEPTCLGNPQVVHQYAGNRDSCVVNHLSPSALTSSGQICSAVANARSCDVNFILDLCSGLTAWVLDMGWLARIQKDLRFQHCYDQANLSRRSLPPEPANQL